MSKKLSGRYTDKLNVALANVSSALSVLIDTDLPSDVRMKAKTHAEQGIDDAYVLLGMIRRAAEGI